MTAILHDCPFCAHRLESGPIVWNEGARVVVGAGHAARLSKCQARLFDTLWRAAHRKSGCPPHTLMDAMYGDDPNGGPDSSKVLSVHIHHLRTRIKPLGMSISAGTKTPLYHLEFPREVA